MKKYNCEVYTIKERKVKDRLRYEIVEKRIYPNISKEKAFLSLIPYKPLFGHTTGRQAKTIWMCFMK